jgi:hypothetical protein
VVAPTKNFCFDSHWQQSHSTRWNCISARTRRVGDTRRHPQMCGESDVEVKVAQYIRIGLHRATQPEKELR